MKNLGEFVKIAPYLEHPLVLVGFGLVLVFGVYRALIRADVLPATRLTMSRHVLAIALMLIALGFGLQFSRDSRIQALRVAASAGLETQIRSECLRRSPAALAECTGLAEQHGKLVDRAVGALTERREYRGRIEAALAQAKQGRSEQLEALLEEAEQRAAARGPEAHAEVARLIRQRAPFALFRSASEYVAALRRSVELDPASAEGWHGLGFGFFLTGEPGRAESAYRRAIDLASDAVSRAPSYTELGMLLLLRGDTNQAEAMQRKALEGFQVAEDKEGMAGVYLALGAIHALRGDLDQAEVLLRKSVALNEVPGGERALAQAPAHAMLGTMSLVRGDLAQAEAMARKSLEVFEARGFQMGMAQSYGLLAAVLDARGDAGQAEAAERKALAINTALDFKIGMAQGYQDLGTRYQNRGELDQAESMFRRSLEVAEAADIKPIAGLAQNRLGSVYRLRGELDRAEAQHRRALDVGSPGTELEFAL